LLLRLLTPLQLVWLALAVFSGIQREEDREKRREEEKRKKEGLTFLSTPSFFGQQFFMVSSQDGLRQALLGHESLSEDNPSTVELTSMVDLPQLRQRKARFQGIRYVPQPIRYFVPEHQPKPQEESTSESATPPRLDIRLDAAFSYPWLFRLLGWLTLTTSRQRWFSPQNLFKIVPVGTILAFRILDGLAAWVIISTNSDPSNVAHIIGTLVANSIEALLW